MGDPFYDTAKGLGPKKIAHWEHWSCPDAETLMSGVDYYDHPRQCRQRLRERYPMLDLPIPDGDAPKPRPALALDDDKDSSNQERHTVRWGDGESWGWQHGESVFRCADDVLRFSPLDKGDFSDWGFVVEATDYRDEEALYRHFRRHFPVEWGDTAPEGSSSTIGFYNTTFMWPLLTFGWDLFLETCLKPEFERIMDEFAEINRRVFRAFCRLPVNFVVCHDDIVTTRGPVCSPKWMRKYVFPRYEEYWSMLKAAGKQPIFMADGCMDAYADDVIACGASGIVTEPYTDFKAIARKHQNVVIAGDGDNRILMRNDPQEIRAMFDGMVETAKMSGGYFLCIGNHIPWNVPPEAVKLYFDLSLEHGFR